jgi:hypothetical protein
MQFKDKVFAVERRGGYPWAEGYFNRNDDALLPAQLPRGGQAAEFRLRVSDDLPACTGRVKGVLLRTVWFGASDDEAVEATLNGRPLPLSARDPNWKDPQIFSPRPQPASGGTGQYKVNPRQRLLRLDFSIDPRVCRQGQNLVHLRLTGQSSQSSGNGIALEKLEVQVQYTGSP